jgi:CheY-like chemotaxis protein
VTPSAPSVYFIDDSATMREVIKIAFRRENMNVIACHDGGSALAQMEELRPDVVISDVIMPDQDGYQVCERIKQHPRLGNTPVILMSGVVNRAVAERSFAVKADELIRKPFEPQDLISRVRRLLGPRLQAAPPAAAISANAALSSIFASAASNVVPMTRVASAAAGPPGAAAAVPGTTGTVLPRPPATSAHPAERYPNAPNAGASGTPIHPNPPNAGGSGSPIHPNPPNAGGSGSPMQPQVAPVAPPRPAPVAPAAPLMTSGPVPSSVPAPEPARGVSARKNDIDVDVQRSRVEVLRLQGLVRKLQSELQAEREYVSALEAHIKTLQEVE